tara:strand:+ start:318 stop:509 length:192 start_codon:yes stop_codon:yes gene_type:complete
MIGKFGLVGVILVLVFVFYLVISFGAGKFSKGDIKPETKQYLRSVNILLVVIALVGIILGLFL